MAPDQPSSASEPCLTHNDRGGGGGDDDEEDDDDGDHDEAPTNQHQEPCRLNELKRMLLHRRTCISMYDVEVFVCVHTCTHADIQTEVP